MIPPDLLAMLRCPVTGQALVFAEAATLDQVNATASFKATPLTAALLREDRQVLYPIRDGIPVLLAEAAVPLR